MARAINLRLEDWQLDQLRAQARADNRSVQRHIIQKLFGQAAVPVARTVYTERVVPVERTMEVERAARTENPAVAERAESSARTVQRERASSVESTEEPERTSIGTLKAVRSAVKRQRRVRCEHRIPAGSFCKVCDS